MSGFAIVQPNRVGGGTEDGVRVHGVLKEKNRIWASKHCKHSIGRFYGPFGDESSFPTPHTWVNKEHTADWYNRILCDVDSFSLLGDVHLLILIV